MVPSYIVFRVRLAHVFLFSKQVPYVENPFEQTWIYNILYGVLPCSVVFPLMSGAWEGILLIISP
jgi:hypothetical protein